MGNCYEVDVIFCAILLDDKLKKECIVTYGIIRYGVLMLLSIVHAYHLCNTHIRICYFEI